MKPIKPPWTERQVLVCTNARDPATGKPSCGMNGSARLREELKIRIKAGGLKGRFAATATGCLDVCPAEGCVVAFHPERDFYLANPTPEGIDEVYARLVGTSD